MQGSVIYSRGLFLLFGEIYFVDAVGLDGEAGDGVLVIAGELEGFVGGLEFVIAL